MKLRSVIFYVSDIEISKQFYNKLGFEIVRDDGKFVAFKTDTQDTYLSINQSDDPNNHIGQQVCCLWTNNIEHYYQKVKTLGTKIVMELSEMHYGKVFIITDPDGNRIEYTAKI